MPRPDTDAEQRRIYTLDRYDVLETAPEEAFDRVTRLATRLFDVPVAMVNFIGQEDQWCLSTVGLDLDHVTLDVSFCVHTIDQGGVMVVEDAREDEKFADNPFVTGEAHIRFYAGAPLRAPNGDQIGTLCLIDTEPRSFSEDEKDTLLDLAGVVMDELNLRHYTADLHDAHEAERALSEQRKRILESITDAFFAVDADWNFTYVNAQAEVFLEQSRDALVGQSVWEAFPEAKGTTFEQQYEAAIEKQTTVEFVEYYPPLGRWFEVKAFPFEQGLSVYFDDVTERVEAEENLQRERNLTEAVMDTSVAALLTIDSDGTITFANAPASEILTTDGSDITGRSVFEQGRLRTMEGEPIPKADRPIHEILEEGATVVDERLIFERPDGSQRYLAVNGAPLRDADDTIRQAVFSIADITEQVQYERELREAKEEAEQASQLKSAFLANMSHDVRTPISSILSVTELLSMELGEEHQERVSLIERSSHRLLDTIDSVLELSKLQAGAVRPEWETVDLAEELRDTVDIFQPQADEADLTLEAEIDPPPTARLDPTMLNRITDNLLSNAIKFTEAGGTVALRAHGDDDSLVVEVEDTGIGIGEDFLPNLFESFAQGSDRVVEEEGGSGLGLAITKRLTELMNGTIEVESEKGVGTCFTITLPR